MNMVGDTAILQCPRTEGKTGLGISMPFLVIQGYFPEGKSFHLELALLDRDGQKRRLIFHNGAKEIVVNHLHARIPISCFVINTWTNISIDMNSFLAHCYEGATFQSLEFICLKTCCKVRRIFTMNMPLRDDTGFEDKNSISFGEIPVKIQFPRAVTFDYYHQLISCERVMGVGKMIQEKKAGEKSRPMSKKKVVPKMAFGRRVPDKETKPTKGKPLRSK